MKKIVLLVMLLMFSGSVFGNDVDFTKTYDSRGVVTFNHTIHATDPDNCVECHEKFDSFGGEMNKDFGHKVCKSCHKQLENKTAPTSCRDCHVKQK